MPTYQVSSVPDFQDALVAQLKLRPKLASVNVVIGPPAPGVAQVPYWIALLEVKNEQKWAAMGRLSKEENYKQKIYISVLTRDGEGDAVAGRNIAYGFYDEVAQQLREDATVNKSVWQAQIEGEEEFIPRLGIQVPDANGQTTTDLSWREACLYFEILVKNRMVAV